MNRFQTAVVSQCERLPVVAYYKRSRGWSFILSWTHRATGVVLVGYLLLHVYTLSSLAEPAVFETKMVFYRHLFFSLLEWAIAIPLVFHAFNGGRLILFEIFNVRHDDIMIRWVLVLGAVFLVVLGYLMVAGDQQVSAGFFWLITLIISGIAGYVVFAKIGKTANRTLWKMQRISGALLLPMLAAHMVFMHLNYAVGHDVNVITIRMQNYFSKGIDIILVALIIFHGTYGVCTIISDYVAKNIFRNLAALITIVVMVACGWAGVKLIITM
jgi:succinate dehydrogenase cytochrome b556 subunit